MQGGTGGWDRERDPREGLQVQLGTPHSPTGRKGQSPCLSLNEMMARNLLRSNPIHWAVAI